MAGENQLYESKEASISLLKTTNGLVKVLFQNWYLLAVKRTFKPQPQHKISVYLSYNNNNNNYNYNNNNNDNGNANDNDNAW